MVEAAVQDGPAGAPPELRDFDVTLKTHLDVLVAQRNVTLVMLALTLPAGWLLWQAGNAWARGLAVLQLAFIVWRAAVVLRTHRQRAAFGDALFTFASLPAVLGDGVEFAVRTERGSAMFDDVRVQCWALVGRRPRKQWEQACSAQQGRWRVALPPDEPPSGCNEGQAVIAGKPREVYWTAAAACGKDVWAVSFPVCSPQQLRDAQQRALREAAVP
jgi:hypothetical protein